MTIKELKERLRDYPEDTEIIIRDPENEINKDLAEVVYIKEKDEELYSSEGSAMEELGVDHLLMLEMGDL